MMADFTLLWRKALDSAEVTHASRLHQVRATFSATLPDEGLQVAGSWRPDNIAELRDLLNLLPETAPARVLASAWQAWGTGLANRLKGPFAIALFDVRARKLFAARDALGVEPLFIARHNETVAISGDPKAARSAAGLASKPNPAMIAGFLRGVLPNNVVTFHEGLERLPPSHSTVFEATLEQTTHRYFDLSAIPNEQPRTDPIERFQSLLDAETLRCGADQENVGILLSGGLDSSAVAAAIHVQRSHPTKPISLSTTYNREPNWADGPHLAAMRAAFDMDHHSREGDNQDPMAHMAQTLAIVDGPSLGFGSPATTELYLMAQRLGVQTLFNGHGGDEVVSYGVGRLNELARNGRWVELARESAGVAALGERSRWRVIDNYLQHKRSWRTLRRLLHRLHAKAAPAPDAATLAEQVFSDDLARAHPPGDYVQNPATRIDHTERDLHEHALFHPTQPHALETLTLLVRHYGFDLAMPFYSRELVEFSLSLPSEWKLHNGYTRYILRESMRGRVPDSIVNRKDKNHFASGFTQNILKSEAIRDLTKNPSPELAVYVNTDTIAAIWAKMEQEPSGVFFSEARALWTVAVLAQWLDSDRDACLKTKA